MRPLDLFKSFNPVSSYPQGLSTDVENYRLVIRFWLLAPFGCQGEPGGNKAKANDHIPGSNMRNWVLGSRDVEDNDPDQTGDKGAHHCWGEPLWALGWGWDHMGKLFCGVVDIVLLLAHS